MNKLFKIGFMSCLAAATILSTSCSKDDEEDNGSDIQVLQKKVKEIVSTYKDDKDYYYFDSEGRITKIEQTYKGQNVGNTTYSYTDSEITVESTITTDLTYTLENGRITKGSSKSNNITFEYTKDGYIAKITENHEIDEFTDVSTYTIENGNVSNIKIERNGKLEGNAKLFYNNTPNNLNVDLGLFMLGSPLEKITGAFGKSIKNLPSKAVAIDGDDTFEASYEYVYNGDYLTKIISTIEDSDQKIVEIIYE